jgi:hypothetical protein
MKWTGPVLAQPQGWTQPSRVDWADVPTWSTKGLGVGWADVPACRRRKETHNWLLCVSTVTSAHSNQLIIFFLHAERAQFTFYR